MNETKFQIDILDGEIAQSQDIPENIRQFFCESFNLTECELKNALKVSSEVLVCKESLVEKAIEFLAAIGLSAEARLAVSKIADGDDDDSLFGNLDVEQITFELDSKEKYINKSAPVKTSPAPNPVIDPLLPKKERSSNDYFAFDPEDDDEENKHINQSTSEDKVSRFVSSALNFSNDDDDDDEQEEVKPPTPKQTIPIKQHRSESSFKITAQSNGNNPEEIKSSVTEPTEIFNSEIVDIQPKPLERLHLVIILVLLSMCTIVWFYFNQGNDPSAGDSISEDQIKSLLNEKKVSKPTSNEKSNNQVRFQESFLANFEFEQITIDSKFHTLNKVLSDINLEIKNNAGIIIEDSEFVSRRYLPKFLAMRISASNLDTANKDYVELSSRINFKLGNENKKGILPIFAKLDATDGKLLISSDPGFTQADNHINLKFKDDNKTLALDLFITIPYQTLNSSDYPSRSISDLIDAELKSKVKEEPKKDKAKPPKNSVD